MTGDIKSILQNSQLASSLRMEEMVASVFRAKGWNATRSPYFVDQETTKIRETDILATRSFCDRTRSEQFFAPRVTIKLVCECKTFDGLNILLFDDQMPVSQLRSYQIWIGEYDEIMRVIDHMVGAAKCENALAADRLHDYFLDRARRKDGCYLDDYSRDYLPPVDIAARAWRETKCGDFKNCDERGNLNGKPVWSAIRSVRSANDALLKSTRESYLNTLSADAPRCWRPTDENKGLSFYYDLALMYQSIHHPVVVSKAKLWKMTNADVSEVHSARIVIEDIQGGWTHVDIVNADTIEDYVVAMTTTFDNVSAESVARMWDFMDKNEWKPGEKWGAVDDICNLLGVGAGSK